MIRATQIEANGLVFDAEVCGEDRNPLVLLLHGFPQTSHTWRAQLPALADAGYFAVAPNQRGYSATARPTRTSDYVTSNLIADSLNKPTFHLVGHDWGGQLAWLIAGLCAERVLTLTVLSWPHPQAFRASFTDDPDQHQRSQHHRALQDPDTVRLLLEDGSRRLHRTLTSQGVPDDAAAAYMERLGNEGALNAALNWYRASSIAEIDSPAVSMPTLYLWGDADASVGRVAAEGTRSLRTPDASPGHRPWRRKSPRYEIQSIENASAALSQKIRRRLSFPIGCFSRLSMPQGKVPSGCG